MFLRFVYVVLPLPRLVIRPVGGVLRTAKNEKMMLQLTKQDKKQILTLIFIQTDFARIVEYGFLFFGEILGCRDHAWVS